MKHFFRNLTLAIICLLCAENLIAQDKKDIFDNVGQIYWFSMNVTVRKNEKELKTKIHETIRFGRVKDYEQAIWKALALNKVIVGPYMSYDEAEAAVQCFVNEWETSMSMDEKKYYSYAVTLSKQNRSGKLEVKSLNHFMTHTISQFPYVVTKGLANGILVIGPFPTEEQAKKSHSYFE